jgi:hypothetical protein
MPKLLSVGSFGHSRPEVTASRGEMDRTKRWYTGIIVHRNTGMPMRTRRASSRAFFNFISTAASS